MLLDWFQDLDKGWLAVLRAQGWDSSMRSGIDVRLPDGSHPATLSQTERTRLKSALIAGIGMLEEWMEALQTQSNVRVARAGQLEDLFSGTLTEMGLLHGDFSVRPSE